MNTRFKVFLLWLVLRLLLAEAKGIKRWLESVLKPFAEHCMRETGALQAVQAAHYQLRVKELRRDFDALRAEATLLRSTGGTSPDNREALLVQQKILHTRCECLTAEIKSAPHIVAPGTGLLLAHLSGIENVTARRRSLLESIHRIAQQIDRPHFYLNFVLTILLPTSSSESLIGDLEEEYALLLTSQGLKRAKAWHRKQAAYSIASAFWQFVARLAALLTIGDAIEKLLKRH